MATFLLQPSEVQWAIFLGEMERKEDHVRG
ncbi:hypothetical protein CCACVL1_27246 [Corchorus capsularis]|uniref:Uncharacterized protein n=1 Tax=Corchorus capsularis TaxID=210143 RepID=A0A1R3GBP9_COCAP|nr:hypothetical protein CCACVL1_27246 [Corchorus capsularis]